MINISESLRQLRVICIFACVFQFLNMNLSGFFGLTFLTLLLVPCLGRAQVNVKDTSLAISIIYPTYGFSMPGADMAKRFGFSHQIGVGYMYKGVSGWSISIEGNFIFRDGVKNPASILAGITTSDGFIIDEGGVFPNIILSERGFSVMAKIGKLFPVIGPNPNSGLLVQFGGGLLQHKIKIDDQSNSTPQLRGDYKKGYDRLCSGPALSQFIGYQHLANARKINFFAGLEFTEAYTLSRRSYYFSEMKRPDEKRFDLLGTLKIGWYLPIYKKTSQQFYYN